MIKATTIFHKENIELDKNIEFDKIYNSSCFGILNLDIEENNVIHNSHIHISIDNSGSMDLTVGEDDKDINDLLFNKNNSKLFILITTLKKIVKVIVDNNFPLSISIDTFNDKICEIIDYIEPNTSNIDFIYNILDNVMAEGSTNIELPIVNSKKKLNDIKNIYLKKNKKVELFFILLTDGESNKGEKDISILKTYLSGFTNIFIGYGINHDFYMLKKLSEQNGEYRFIEKINNVSFVCSEILSNIVYKKIKNITLKIINGKIYNYEKNKWSSKLYIHSISSCFKKVFHLQTYNISKIKIVLNGTIVNTNKKTCKIIKPNIFDKKIKDDLTIYIFRQKVQTLIFNTITDYNNKNELFEIVEFLKYMKNYMENNNLNNNYLMMTLCDDLYVIIINFNNKKYNKMFSLSRQCSQGNQYIYNNNFIENCFINHLINFDNNHTNIFLHQSNNNYNNNNFDLNNNNFDLNNNSVNDLDIPLLTREITNSWKYLSNDFYEKNKIIQS